MLTRRLMRRPCGKPHKHGFCDAPKTWRFASMRLLSSSYLGRFDLALVALSEGREVYSRGFFYRYVFA